ncbi:MAG: hypothetical protein A2Z50_00970 [Nitrospirae bacterium RBG_19FT_COMBO_42_15]|nr:MAG: hypothetical protein A2Z50_00970 [Nitrospirae bacterium RBG_19FT_COMBO_42_15]
MTLKERIFKIIIKALIFLKKDLDVSRQRMLFYSTMRKDVKEMDKDQLGQLIRFTGHSLDKATKCENESVGRGKEKKELLEMAINEWERRGYAMGPDKIWAKEILKRYNLWCDGSSKLIQPSKEQIEAEIDNNLFSVIEHRRSVRFWKRKKVEREKIEKIIKAATFAPTSCNRMAWHFFVVENDFNNIVEGNSTNKDMLEKAPVRIYLAIDERLYPEIYAPAMDAGFTLQNLVLAAHALGLGSCLMYHCESVNQGWFRSNFNMPDYYRVYCAVLLGYPDEIPSMPARVSVEDATTFIEGSNKHNIGKDYFGR